MGKFRYLGGSRGPLVTQHPGIPGKHGEMRAAANTGFPSSAGLFWKSLSFSLEAGRTSAPGGAQALGCHVSARAWASLRATPAALRARGRASRRALACLPTGDASQCHSAACRPRGVTARAAPPPSARLTQRAPPAPPPAGLPRQVRFSGCGNSVLGVCLHRFENEPLEPRASLSGVWARRSG